jgi:hypothetical protein
VTNKAGRPEEAKTQLTAAWEASGESHHAMRCVVAHSLADVQDDVHSELEWDQWALDAHAFLPSLHLDLGDAWLRAGDRAQAEAG